MVVGDVLKRRADDALDLFDRLSPGSGKSEALLLLVADPLGDATQDLASEITVLWGDRALASRWRCSSRSVWTLPSITRQSSSRSA